MLKRTNERQKINLVKGQNTVIFFNKCIGTPQVRGLPLVIFYPMGEERPRCSIILPCVWKEYRICLALSIIDTVVLLSRAVLALSSLLVLLGKGSIDIDDVSEVLALSSCWNQPTMVSQAVLQCWTVLNSAEYFLSRSEYFEFPYFSGYLNILCINLDNFVELSPESMNIDRKNLLNTNVDILYIDMNICEDFWCIIIRSTYIF